MKNRRFVISPQERRELCSRAQGHCSRAADAKRAQLILLLAEGESYVKICERLGCSTSFVSRWKARFLEDRLAGLYPRHRGSRLTRLTPRLEARILSWTEKTPPDGSASWSTRRLGKHLGINHMLVYRAWARAGHRPQRRERHVAGEEPDLATKALDIIGLYLNPPQNAVVFCVGEMVPPRTFDHSLPVLPCSTQPREGDTLATELSGVLTLLAALNPPCHAACGETISGHTSAEFVAFLEDLVAHQAAGQEMQVLADALSLRSTQRVRSFLARNPSVHIRCAPTHACWLDQIGLWFSKLHRDLLVGSNSSLAADLDQTILRLIRDRNRATGSYKWCYRDASRGVRAFGSGATDGT